MRKPILCLDFDGVIHSYTSGWKGAAIIPDPPVPGAMCFIAAAVEVFTVAIFSSRSHQEGGIEAMKEYLIGPMVHYVGTQSPEAPVSTCRLAADAILEQIVWAKEKPSAMVTLDDRAITFRGKWPHPGALLDFVPWNKGGMIMSDVEPVRVAGLTVAQITELAASFQERTGYDPRTLTANNIRSIRM